VYGIAFSIALILITSDSPVMFRVQPVELSEPKLAYFVALGGMAEAMPFPRAL
jgi:hypothetical protein